MFLNDAWFLLLMRDPYTAREKKRDEFRTLMDSIYAYVQNSTLVAADPKRFAKTLGSQIKLDAPLAMARNLKQMDYLSKATTMDLWNIKKLYEDVKDRKGLIYIGDRFLSQKNYHGAYEAFHAAQYNPGLLDMTRQIVRELKTDSSPARHSEISYAKKALVDIVENGRKEMDHVEKKEVHRYINTIADAYYREYKESTRHDGARDESYLKDAQELYMLNHRFLKVMGLATRQAYDRFAHEGHVTDAFAQKYIR